MVLGADDDDPFEALTSEADEDIGIAPGLIRVCSCVQVNDHAAARNAVHGPQASGVPLYERVDDGEQWIDRLDDNDEIAQWKEGDYFPRILLEYLKIDRVRIGVVGNSEAELFLAKGLSLSQQNGSSRISGWTLEC
jgi:hypothetical protein